MRKLEKGIRKCCLITQNLKWKGYVQERKQSDQKLFNLQTKYPA